MTHTPGPWLVEQPSSNEGEAEVITSPSRTVCWTASTWDAGKDEDVVTDEDRANARLIAAAPDLLAACRVALDYFNETRSGREWRDNGGEEPLLLAAAIAKAEGRDAT